MPRYNHATIEPKWQAYWDQHQTFAAPRMPKPGTKKLYALDMFPYPSGDGLHVGHPEGYTATDIVCRAARMQGQSVIHPMGFDAFGLPAEEHAIKTGEHPRIRTEKNIDYLPPPIEIARLLLRLVPRARHDRRRILPLDAMDLPANLRHLVRCTTQQRGRPISELPIPADVKVARRRRRPHLPRRTPPRLSIRSPGELVPCPRHGARQRRSHRRQKRSAAATRSSACRCGNGCSASPPTPTASKKTSKPLDWSEGIKALQRNWIGRSTGAEVDFFIGPTHLAPGESPGAAFEAWKAARTKSGFPRKPERRRPPHLHHPPRHALRRNLHGDRPRAPVRRPPYNSRPKICRRGLSRSRRPQERPRPHRTRQRKNRRLHRQLRHQPRERRSQRQSGSPTTSSSATAPARSWPSPRTTNAISNSPSNSSCRSQPSSIPAKRCRRKSAKKSSPANAAPPKTASPSTPANTTASRPPSSKQKIAADLADARPRPRRRQLQTPRLALLPPTLLGRTLPDPPRARRGRQTHRPHPRRRRERPARRPAPPRRLQTPRPPRAAARQSTARVALSSHRRQTLQARNQHHAPVGRLLLVLPAIPRPHEHKSSYRSSSSKKPGCPSTSTSAAPSTPCSICSTRASGTKSSYDRGIVSMPEPFQKLVNQGMILGENNEKMSKAAAT